MKTTTILVLFAASLGTSNALAFAQDRGSDKPTTIHQSRAAATTTARNTVQKHHAAQLKTGQFTARQSAHLKTRNTALHPPVSNGRKQRHKQTSEDPLAAPGKDSNPIHLREHNARMF